MRVRYSHVLPLSGLPLASNQPLFFQHRVAIGDWAFEWQLSILYPEISQRP
jgi:hypothetical protein